MISVVIPTLWRYEPFCDFLAQTCAHDHVHDVIIVDNCRSHRPTHSSLNHSKVTLLDFGENLFVNPSWNVGVYHAQSDIICLQNDDLTFDCKVYQKVSEFVQPHMGLVSLSSLPATGTQIEFEHWQGQNMFGCGQLMFFHRSRFCQIDPELLVYCGDNWLFDHMHETSGQNYMIRNLQHDTPYAQTSKHFRHMLTQEQLVYAQVCEKHKIHAQHV